MGLLDEAIRDHLELKRRRGADPSEIARAEHEALEPVFPPEDAAPGAAEKAEESPLDYDSEPEPLAPPPVAAEATVAQDTAEIDMRAVLEEGGAAQAAPAAEAAVEQELLEWETPARAAQDEEPVPHGPPHLEGTAEPEQIPGQESISFE
jgi:hypothetical protein